MSVQSADTRLPVREQTATPIQPEQSRVRPRPQGVLGRQVSASISDRRALVMGTDERQGRALARALGLLCPVEYSSLRLGLPKGPLPDAVITLGTPLGTKEQIEMLRRALRPFLANAVPVLCLLDKPTPREELQARAIGASRVMAQDSPSRVIATAVRAVLGGSPRATAAARQAAMRSVAQDVGFTLADLMNAAASGGTVDGRLPDQACTLLLSALEGDSIADWMETVSHIHDPTFHHCLLMAGIMATFVLRLGFKRADCERLTRAAILHDIGKALIPVELINKASCLTDEEMATMRCHAAFGHELLATQGGHHPQVLDIVRHHHEYLDGSGYPDGLHANAISDPVRIATICDVFTALVERRSYKPSLSPSEAFALLEQMGDKLDLSLLHAFRGVIVGPDQRRAPATPALRNQGS